MPQIVDTALGEKRMSSTAKSRHFRLEDEYMEMLDSIQKREDTGDNTELTRTDVLKRVIKKEYLSSINATSGNALFELIDSSVEAQLERQIKVIDGIVSNGNSAQYLEILKNLYKIIGLLKLLMNASNVNRLDNLEKWISMDTRYEIIIENQVDELILEKIEEN